MPLHTPDRRPRARGTVLARIFALVSLIGLSLVAGRALAAPFDDGWRFFRGPAGAEIAAPTPDATGWETVSLPHTARIEPRVVQDQWQGLAWYAKTFATDPAWRGKTVLVRFEGAMSVADVSLNGKLLAHHEGGFTPFAVDLTPALKPKGANRLVVRLDDRDNPILGPKPLKALDFNSYGGLYRGVELIVKPPVHVTDETLADTVAGGGIFVTYPRADAKMALVAVKTQVANAASSARKARLIQTLFDGDVQVARIESPLDLAAGATTSLDQTLEVIAPHLWSPRSPHLYRLVTQVVSGGETDRTETRIGIRRLSITPDGLRINGEKIFAAGVNRHQEYPYVGYALTDADNWRDARLIKQAGFDYVRLSHYEQSPAFLAAADALGLVVMEPILGWQYFNPDPAFAAHALKDCRDLIRRDRNHPSVIAWECSLNETDMPRALTEAFNKVVHAEYPGDQAWSAGWQYDSAYDIYIQARQHRGSRPAPTDRPYIVSEYGDWEYFAQDAGFHQDSWSQMKPEARNSRQGLGSGEAGLLQQVANVAEAHDDDLSTPAFADGYWVMFDYNRGLRDPGQPASLETSGIMTLERAPKFSWFFFRSQRDPDDTAVPGVGGPMVFIASWWRPGSSPHVHVYSNAEEVELLVNGRSLGRRKPVRDAASSRLPHPPFLFDAGGFAPGALEARAYIGGRLVATDRVTTPGAPAGLKVWLDDAGIPAKAGDLLFARAQLVDAAGAPSRVSGTAVAFTCPDRACEIVGGAEGSTEGGLASALVRVRKPDRVRVVAKAPGLTAAGGR